MKTDSATAPELELQEPHWISRQAFPVLTGIFALTQTTLGVCVYHGWTWLSVALMLFLSHIMHGLLIGFHEASHGMLRKSRKLNEVDGIILGIFSFTSFSLYRAAHQTHHAFLSSERDEELWPFVDTTKPRWFRVLAAFLELFFGIVFTPLIFVRTFLRKNSPIRKKSVRRRIWMEFGLIATVWAGIFTAVTVFGVWKYLLWLFLVPAFIAANLQSWRKYIEHVGLTGKTVRSATRSIVADTWSGQIVSFTLLHEPYHGVHHQHAGLPHAELPMRTAELQPEHPDEYAPFPSYRHALVHLLGCLTDPRVGAQWRTQTAEAQPTASNG
jgi:fatty acid desaturase